jgi:redox-sensitive bicupin YhaK (pirin superfamily)
MPCIIHNSETRGQANHGWLKAKHSFSFANWYNPERINFGALRVLNDDVVSPGMGFGTHPHENMEIITIPLKGSLRHQDSMGFSEVIHAGEVQVMSAGTGIYHSEYNASDVDEINLFQIWIFPNKENVEPRYDQIDYSWEDCQNRFLQLVSPNSDDKGTWIYQDAWIHIAEISESEKIPYQLKNPNNGVYFMNIEGTVDVLHHELDNRDAIGIWNESKIEISAKTNSKILAIEVPMSF